MLGSNRGIWPHGRDVGGSVWVADGSAASALPDIAQSVDACVLSHSCTTPKLSKRPLTLSTLELLSTIMRELSAPLPMWILPQDWGFTPKLPYSNQVKKPCFSAVQCLMSSRPTSLKMPAAGTAHDPMHMVATVGTCHDSPAKMATTGWNINHIKHYIYRVIYIIIYIYLYNYIII